MEPNKLLSDIRECITDVDESEPNSPEEFAAALMLVDLVRVLDEQLSKGESLPTAWVAKPTERGIHVRHCSHHH